MADPVLAALTPPGDDRARLVAPPSQGFVTGEDNLRISSFNALTGVQLTISGRMYDLESRTIVPFSRTHTPNTDRTLKQTVEKLGIGFILNAMVRATSGSPVTGQTYVLLEIVRGQTTSADVVGVLGAGDVTARQGLAFPGGVIQPSIDSAGVLRSIAGSTPAAGADISETVPTGARWELVAMVATLSASATAGNRFPSLLLDDGTNVFFRSHDMQVVTANQAFFFSWGQGMPLITTAGASTFGNALPRSMELLAGYRIRTSTPNLAVNDQWSAVRLFVRERLEGA